MKLILTILKSFNFWMFLILVVSFAFCHYYPRHILVYDNFIDRFYEPIIWGYYWLFFLFLWVLVYVIFCQD